MKRYLLIAVGLVILLGVSITFQPLKAQVYGDFDTIRIVYNSPYVELTQKTVVQSTNFGLPPNWAPDLDDGYSFANGIDIGWPFEFNGEVYTKLWICVNGFITFSPPPFYPAKTPQGLFIQNVSYPINVVAPFWGDHRFRLDVERFNGYMPSEISYYADDNVFVVQWKNLQINDQSVKSSIANFQVRLYRSSNPYSGQGDIEFCYGQIGGNTYDPGQLVVTRGASVGIKGEFADFLNGLYFQKADGSYNADDAKTKQTLTNEWTPSGGNEKRIRFNAFVRLNIDQWWGDGDADMSKGPGQKHSGMDQNRFVTINDARLIMHSVATKVPLDSVRRRNAFHADVNHNGRYWWPDPATKSLINWRDKFEGSNLPVQVNTIKRIYFEANEYDAALILHYMACRLPYLPWLLDTIPQYGKLAAENKATNINFGSAQKVGENTYNIPVYLNGSVNGALGTSFELNGTVTDINVLDNNEGQLFTDFSGNNVVISGAGKYGSDNPICYVTVISNTPELKITNVRFNDKHVPDVNLALLSVNSDDSDGSYLQNSPNPVVNSTVISVNIQNAGNYTLAIYDVTGHRVKMLANGYLNNTVNQFTWDGTNELGEKVQSGAYIYRLIGENVTLSKKMFVER